MEPPSANTNNETTTTKINLFDYTEEELYCSNTNSNHGNNNASANSNSNSKPSSTKPLKFNHYELLQIPIHATSHDIKKAYRKLSLQYHPDKTGRDENDYGKYCCCWWKECGWFPVNDTHTHSLTFSLNYLHAVTNTNTNSLFGHQECLRYLDGSRQTEWLR